MIFKFVAKAYALRLSPIAHRTINRSQSAFIKGRHILEGILSLQEIIHETKRKKLGGVFLKLDFEKAFDRVDWGFLREVLLRKGFDPAWVHRAMGLVSGGHTAISINGEIGPYFKNKRGVRQGDPLSPLLFDFAVDALAETLDKAKSAGHIKGLVPHLIPGGVSHLQYADDTIIMVEPDDLGIANLKFLLLCFKSMSGLRINFHKSEVLILGKSTEEQTRIANRLNCKLGSFPLSYLGLPVSDRALTAADWNPLTAKVAKRADPWFGKMMSSAARLTLTNTCLSNLPLHAMGVFLLGEGVHKTMDGLRGRFFWEANNLKRKYHMVRWPVVCRPRKLGGLGIVDTRLMNKCLMVKWIWKLVTDGQGLWADIIRAKYLRSKDLLVDHHNPGSQFWNAIQKLKPLFCLGAKHRVHNGSSTRFWLDWWLGSGPLRARFPNLFSIATDPECSVGKSRALGDWDISFRRTFSLQEQVEWDNLLRELHHVVLTEGRDEFTWTLEPSGRFSTKSLYLKLCEGSPMRHYAVIWKIAAPLKIRIFLWQLTRKRLPTRLLIQRRQGPSSGRCALCDAQEDVNHIFFECTLARFMWSVVRELLPCSWNPSCFAEVYRLIQCHQGQDRRVLWSCIAALCWTLWNVRNKYSIEGSFPSQPADCIYKLSVYLQMWRLLSRRCDRPAMDAAISRIRDIHASTRDVEA